MKQNRAWEQLGVSLARGAKRLMLRDARGTAGRVEQLDVPWIKLDLFMERYILDLEHKKEDFVKTLF